MNKLIRYGLLLQIPNILIISILGIFAMILGMNWIFNQLTLYSVFWIITGSVYCLINIFSLIMIISGVTDGRN